MVESEDTISAFRFSRFLPVGRGTLTRCFWSVCSTGDAKSMDMPSRRCPWGALVQWSWSSMWRVASQVRWLVCSRPLRLCRRVRSQTQWSTPWSFFEGVNVRARAELKVLRLMRGRVPIQADAGTFSNNMLPIC